MSKHEVDRRTFLQMFATALVAVPLVGMNTLLSAADLKSLPKGKKAMDEKATLPNILGYKHDATQVDAKRFKKYVAGQNCANCVQYVKTNDGWGECKIIKNLGLVSKDGWCSSYLAKKA